MLTTASTRPSLLQPGAKQPPSIRCAPPDGEAAGVIDAATFETIEVDKLFDSLNHCETLTGQATLYRDLCYPLDQADAVRSRQEALREIEAQPELRQGLEQLLKRAKVYENDLYQLLYATFMGLVSAPAHELEIEGYGYATYIRGTRFMLQLVDDAKALPAVQSRYLRCLINSLRDFGSSRAYRLARGPAYRGEKGMLSREEKHWYTPALRFQPSLFKPVALLLVLLGVVAVGFFVPLFLELVGSISPVVWLFLMPLALLYIPIVGGFDRDGCIYPLREIFKASPELELALEALGRLEVLMSCLRFREHFQHPTCLPDLLDSEHHVFLVKAVRNPILAKNNADYVSNDLDLRDTRVTLITGPNSGGKTAFCKTVAQTQLLAQIGCYVPAEFAALSVADRIFYQVPEISHLTDGEGRFGTELRHTKKIFLATSPHSLVIMDELSEGTTHEEKIEISKAILEGFYRKGNSTLLITHNHELVDRLLEAGIGDARQVEFRDERPTYRLIPGISRVSHADRVAKKIGFSKEDIARYLNQKP